MNDVLHLSAPEVAKMRTYTSAQVEEIVMLALEMLGGFEFACHSHAVEAIQAYEDGVRPRAVETE